MSALPNEYKRPLVEACAPYDDTDWGAIDEGASPGWETASGPMVERGLIVILTTAQDDYEIKFAVATELGRIAARWLVGEFGGEV